MGRESRLRRDMPVRELRGHARLTMEHFRELARRENKPVIQTGIACPRCRGIDRFRLYVDLASGSLIVRCSCAPLAGACTIAIAAGETLPEGT